MKKDSKAKIASTYALALYASAKSDKQAVRIFGDVKRLLQVLEVEKDFAKDFANPLWAINSKKEALKKISKKLSLSEDVQNCLNILLDNSHINELKVILEEYKSIYYKKHDTVVVKVHSAKELSSAQNKKLHFSMERSLKKKVIIDYIIRPEILGGLIVEYNSNMIDDSVLGKLNRLELIMKGGNNVYKSK